jgi:hypothetical protein
MMRNRMPLGTVEMVDSGNDPMSSLRRSTAHEAEGVGGAMSESPLQHVEDAWQLMPETFWEGRIGTSR